jgi:hypothetical protein
MVKKNKPVLDEAKYLTQEEFYHLELLQEKNLSLELKKTLIKAAKREIALRQSLTKKEYELLDLKSKLEDNKLLDLNELQKDNENKMRILKKQLMKRLELQDEKWGYDDDTLRIIEENDYV